MNSISRCMFFDGAMGTQIHAAGLSPEDYGGAHLEGCGEALILHNPDVIERTHDAYFAAGADVIETDTFQGGSG